MPTLSMPDILRVQGPRLVHVARSLDDGPAVGEHGELITLDGEVEQKTVVIHLAKRLQVARQLLEIKTCGRPLRDLHGIAATQAGGVRALFAVQPLEAPPPAAWAIDFAQERCN